MKINLKNDLNSDKVYYLNSIKGISCLNDNSPQTKGLVQFLKLNKNAPIKDISSELKNGKDFINLLKPHIEGSIDVEINYDLLGNYTLGTIHTEGSNKGSLHQEKREITIDPKIDDMKDMRINLTELHIHQLRVFEVELNNVTYLFPYHVFHQHYLMISNFITKWMYHPPSDKKIDQIYNFVEDYKDEHGDLKDVIKLTKNMSDQHDYFAAELHFHPEIMERYNLIYTKRLQYRHEHKNSDDPKYDSPFCYPKFTFPTDERHDLTIHGYEFYPKDKGATFMVTEITKSVSYLDIPPYNYVPGLPKPRNADPDEKLKNHNFKNKKLETEETKTLDTNIRPSSDLSSLLLDSRSQRRTYKKPPKVSKVIPKQTTKGSTITGVEKSHVATGDKTSTNQKAHDVKHHTKNNTLDNKIKEAKSIKRIDKSKRLEFMDKTLICLYDLFKIKNVEYLPEYFYYNLENNKNRYNRVIYYPNGKNRQVMVTKLRLNNKHDVYLFEIDIQEKESEGDVKVTIPEEIHLHHSHVIDEEKTLSSPMSSATLLVFDKNSTFRGTDVTVFLNQFCNNNGSWAVKKYMENPTRKFLIYSLSRKTKTEQSRANTLFNKINEIFNIYTKPKSQASSLSGKDRAHDQNNSQQVA